MSLAIHKVEDRVGDLPKSSDTSSSVGRLKRPTATKPGRQFAVVFEGVKYLRAAREAMEKALPGVSTYERCKAAAAAIQATGVSCSIGTAENILYPNKAISSIRSEYLIPILGYAASEDVNTMRIEGVPEVMKFMVGKNVLELIHHIYAEPGQYSQVIDGRCITVSISEVSP